MHFSESQQSAIATFENIVLKGRQNMWLVGAAGTGKTAVTAELIAKTITFLQIRFGRMPVVDVRMFEGSNKFLRILPEGYSKHVVDEKEHMLIPISVIAPTHKAKSVIYNQVKKYATTFFKHNTKVVILFGTTTQYLEKEMTYSLNGTQLYERKRKRSQKVKCELKLAPIVFVDEISMISHYDAAHLLKRLSNTFVYIGDQNQLPPVKEITTPMIENANKNRLVVLEQVIRAANNETRDLYTLFRNFVTSAPGTIATNLSHSLTFPGTEFWACVVMSFVPGQDKIVTYSNASVDNYNKMFRQCVMKATSPIVQDEKLILDDNYNSFYNSQELTVVNEPETKPLSCAYIKATFNVYSFKCLPTTDESECEEPTEFTKILPSDEKKCQALFEAKKMAILEQLNSFTQKSLPAHIMNDIIDFSNDNEETTKNVSLAQKLWKEYYENYQLFFPPIKYAYASTVYKAQGSTYTKCFVDMDNILLCCARDHALAARCAYTAVTRGQDSVIIKLK